MIDCGLSAKQAEIRMAQLGIDPCTLSAILVTHEHSDHICGVSTLSRRFKIPVYANRATHTCIKNIYGKEVFNTGQRFSIGDAEITPFAIVHDALEPVGFSILCRGF